MIELQRSFLLAMAIAAMAVLMPLEGKALPIPVRENYKSHIQEHYSNQLTSPEARKRLSFSQFGYGLSFFEVPLFPINGLINPDNFGEHSYGRPGSKERNGALYTCKGGFIDFSHVRVGADWTVYLAFRMICEGGDMDLPSSDGSLHLQLRKVERLSLESILALAQRIAFERLTWHEIASWYYHPPNYSFSQRQSTFTPEDTYSNFVGTVIGRQIVLRILRDKDGLSYEQIATEEIERHIASLMPVENRKQTKEAYDIVDVSPQEKLPEGERNADVWWDNRVAMIDGRYVFKRCLDIGPHLEPWLVPKAEQAGCPIGTKAQKYTVPQRNRTGGSLHRYYTLTITPDSLLFYDRQTDTLLYEPFKAFESKDMDKVMATVTRAMEKELLAGFDRRDSVNPQEHFTGLRKRWFP